MNDKMSENGFLLSRLVFGIITWFLTLYTDLINKFERMTIISREKAEMNTIIAERRVLAALNGNIHLAVDIVQKIGEEILVYVEEDKQWKGLFIVFDFTGRQATVLALDETKR